MATFPVEQARTIRAAQQASRTLQAWSATVVVDGATTTKVVFAVSDRAAYTVAAAAGRVVRVGPAKVRDMAGALARALAAAPPARSSRSDDTAPLAAPVRPAERLSGSDYLRGYCARPSDAAVNLALGRTVVLRAKGEPKRLPTVGVPRAVLAPIVGEYTLTGGRRAA